MYKMVIKNLIKIFLIGRPYTMIEVTHYGQCVCTHIPGDAEMAPIQDPFKSMPESSCSSSNCCLLLENENTFRLLLLEVKRRFLAGFCLQELATLIKPGSAATDIDDLERVLLSTSGWL